MFDNRFRETQIFVRRNLPRHRPIACWLTFIIAFGSFGQLPGSLADTFVFESGQKVQGTIVLATRDAITIERANGELHVGKIADMREVRLDTQNGYFIRGRFLGWSSNGIYEIEADGHVVRIRDGEVLSDKAQRVETDQTPPSSQADQENAQAASDKPGFLNFLRQQKGKELAE